MAAAHSSKINLSAHHSYCAQTPATHNVKLLKHNQINLKYSPCRPSFKPLRLLYYKTHPPTGRKIALADAKGQTAQTPAKIENVDTRPIYQRERQTKSLRLHPQIPKSRVCKAISAICDAKRLPFENLYMHLINESNQTNSIRRKRK